MNNPEFELLVYLITSARALPEEPASYGSTDLLKLLPDCVGLYAIMTLIIKHIVNFLTVLKLIREKP